MHYSLRELLDQRMHIRILKSVPLLKELPDNKLEVLVNVLQTRHYDEGSYIIKQGEEGNEFYIIKEGVVGFCSYYKLLKKSAIETYIILILPHRQLSLGQVNREKRL
jgi:signal-transduction protein with cAMP-binding, CBS, and nucleotidyltransferase domain